MSMGADASGMDACGTEVWVKSGCGVSPESMLVEDGKEGVGAEGGACGAWEGSAPGVWLRAGVRSGGGRKGLAGVGGWPGEKKACWRLGWLDACGLVDMLGCCCGESGKGARDGDCREEGSREDVGGYMRG